MPTMERMRLALRLESVVVKAVGLVPQARPTQAIHRIGDVDEMLEELGGDVLLGRIVLGQFQRDGEHRHAIERHPGRSVRLFQVAARRQRLGTIKHADVVQAEKAFRKQMLPGHVLAVDPPGEIDEPLLKGPRQKVAVAPIPPPGHLVDAPASPGMHGRVTIRRVFMSEVSLFFGANVGGG